MLVRCLRCSKYRVVRSLCTKASAGRNRCFFSGYIHSTDTMKEVLISFPLVFLEVYFQKCSTDGHCKYSPGWVQRTLKIQRTPSCNMNWLCRVFTVFMVPSANMKLHNRLPRPLCGQIRKNNSEFFLLPALLHPFFF